MTGRRVVAGQKMSIDRFEGPWSPGHGMVTLIEGVSQHGEPTMKFARVSALAVACVCLSYGCSQLSGAAKDVGASQAVDKAEASSDSESSKDKSSDSSAPTPRPLKGDHASRHRAYQARRHDRVSYGVSTGRRRVGRRDSRDSPARGRFGGVTRGGPLPSRARVRRRSWNQGLSGYALPVEG